MPYILYATGVGILYTDTSFREGIDIATSHYLDPLIRLCIFFDHYINLCF